MKDKKICYSLFCYSKNGDYKTGPLEFHDKIDLKM